jgi:hypothetical protein
MLASGINGVVQDTRPIVCGGTSWVFVSQTRILVDTAANAEEQKPAENSSIA